MDNKSNHLTHDGVYYNGCNNDYPEVVERLINASSTAKGCSSVLSKFMYCNGFDFEFQARANAKASRIRFDRSQFYINQKKETPNSLLRKVCNTLSKQRGVFFHINYNALYQKTSVQIIPYKDVRIGKADDNNYSGMYCVRNDWAGFRGLRLSSERKEEWINAYNPDPRIIQAQVEKAGGWKYYKGQVFFLNLDNNDRYPLSFFDSVLTDCDSERQSTIYANDSFRKGFFGNYIVLTKPFETEDDRSDFREALQAIRGVGREDSVVHLEKILTSDTFEEEFKLVDIKTNINDKLFAYTDEKCARNIRTATNVPTVLLEEVQGKLGATSGESLAEAQLYMQKKLEEERNAIEDAFEELFDNFERPINPSGLFEIKLLV